MARRYVLRGGQRVNLVAGASDVKVPWQLAHTRPNSPTVRLLCLFFASLSTLLDRARSAPLPVRPRPRRRHAVAQWNGSRARLRCFTCECEAWLDGFTISECDPGKLPGMALVDQARKHRKRSPQEVDAIRRAQSS